MGRSTEIRAVLFDVVGTLIEPHPSVAAAYAAAGRRFGSRLTDDEIAPRFRAAFDRQEALDRRPGHLRTSTAREHERWRSIVAEVFRDVANQDALFDALWDHFAGPNHWRLFDDVAQSVDQLSKRPVVLGLASNFDERLHTIRQCTPALAKVEHAFVSSELGVRKPAPAFFDAIAARLKLPPEALLMVGNDAHNDVTAARAVGWQAVLVDRRAQASTAEVLASLGDLPDWLDRSTA